MPCGKKPLVKKWDKHKHIRVVTPSRYEQNEASVKAHWKKVIRDLELSYKDDQFWETQRDAVKGLVGPTIYRRLAHVFNLPQDNHYEPPTDTFSLPTSEQFYDQGSNERSTPKEEKYSESNMESSVEEETVQDEESDWGTSTDLLENQTSKFKSTSSKNLMSKYNVSRMSTMKSFTMLKSTIRSKKFSNIPTSINSPAYTDDDLIVQDSKTPTKYKFKSQLTTKERNPHFEMLYCNESETDMIKWNSKYKQKAFEISASDEFSKKVEILTKQVPGTSVRAVAAANAAGDLKRRKYAAIDTGCISCMFEPLGVEMLGPWGPGAHAIYKELDKRVINATGDQKAGAYFAQRISLDFFDWWVSLGNLEFKSEIKRPEDIEALFQVLFDEHASRALVLDPKILPCVLPSIAKFVGIPKASCPSVLKRQIAFDIRAETSPAHTKAFGSCLPQKMKHIPPNNDTKKTWHSLVIPEDLKTMSAVWDKISHLTSTKAFHAWLQKRPHLPMAPYLQKLGSSDKKQSFVVPSDFVLSTEGSSITSVQDLAFPVSAFTLELKEVLQEIMND